jgi:purine-nucleoside phosphorylase
MTFVILLLGVSGIEYTATGFYRCSAMYARNALLLNRLIDRLHLYSFHKFDQKAL